MVRRFSKQPAPKASAKPVAAGFYSSTGMPSNVSKFKSTYVFERRMLEKFRSGKEAEYNPSPSLDGVSRWDTPEEKQKENAWIKEFKRLEGKINMEPSTYVRMLFKVLRGSSIAIPTVGQLASSNMRELVASFIQDCMLELRQQFVAESQRAEASIRTYNKGAGYPVSLSVYYAILDSKTGLSPLYKYCLAKETARTYEGDKHAEKLLKLAKEYELLAAMDYMLYPDKYDEVWGSVIPSNFRVAACKLLDSAMER